MTSSKHDPSSYAAKLPVTNGRKGSSLTASVDLSPVIRKLTLNYSSEAVSIVRRSYGLARRGKNQSFACLLDRRGAGRYRWRLVSDARRVQIIASRIVDPLAMLFLAQGVAHD